MKQKHNNNNNNNCLLEKKGILATFFKFASLSLQRKPVNFVLVAKFNQVYVES